MKKRPEPNVSWSYGISLSKAMGMSAKNMIPVKNPIARNLINGTFEAILISDLSFSYANFQAKGRYCRLCRAGITKIKTGYRIINKVHAYSEQKYPVRPFQDKAPFLDLFIRATSTANDVKQAITTEKAVTNEGKWMTAIGSAYPCSLAMVPFVRIQAANQTI